VTLKAKRAIAWMSLLASGPFAACVSSQNGASGSGDAGAIEPTDSGGYPGSPGTPGHDAATDTGATEEGDGGVPTHLDAGTDAPPLPSGSLDPGFNGTGSTTGAPFALPDGGAGAFTNVTALAADSQGRLVVVGGASTPWEEIGAWRFLASGAPDTTFGTNGELAFVDLGDNDYARSACIDGSGNVLVGGSTLSGSSGFGVLWRFTSAGALDTAFGTNGSIDPPGDGAGNVFAIACTAAGTLLAGSADPYGATVWRYTTAGALDTAGFASPNGFVQDETIYGAYTGAKAIAIDGTGRIVVAGSVDNDIGTANFGTGVWRFSSTGVLDTTLGGAGLVVPEQQFDAGGVDAGGFTWSNAVGVAVDSSNDIVVADAAGVARLTPTGALDTTFAGGLGRVELPVPAAAASSGSSVQVYGVAVDGQGRILVVGTAYAAGSAASFMTVWRLTSAGALDPTFGTGGSFATRGTAGGSTSQEGDMGAAIVVDSSNRPLVAGSSALAAGGNVPVVWRLTP
jgi:uncharacterized delta-60 repeat protein